MIRTTALLLLCVAGCCVPQSYETAPAQPEPLACRGYLQVLRQDGEGHTLSLRTPDGAVYALAFWAGRLQGTSGAVNGGDPALVSCGERCLQASGEVQGDACVEALWRRRTRWHVVAR